MFDKVTNESYGDAIRGAHTAIPRLLALFQDREIHATWATVGMVSGYHLNNLRDLCPLLPNQPQYIRTELSAYQHLAAMKYEEEVDLELYLAPELIEQIVATPGQELASHTFGHYYCLEAQVPESDPTETFTADALAEQQALERFGVSPRSIVFPRNQWTPEALAVLKRLDFVAYRGTENHLLYRARNDFAQNNRLVRALRLIDHYVNISGHHTYTLAKVNRNQQPLINVPASRFLRPHSRWLAFLRPLQLHRIKRAMTKAAKRNEIFHLWWHPHNFGRNQKQNFAMLESILDHYAVLHERYGWQSANMQEVADPHPEEAVAAVIKAAANRPSDTQKSAAHPSRPASPKPQKAEPEVVHLQPTSDEPPEPTRHLNPKLTE